MREDWRAKVCVGRGESLGPCGLQYDLPYRRTRLFCRMPHSDAASRAVAQRERAGEPHRCAAAETTEDAQGQGAAALAPEVIPKAPDSGACGVTASISSARRGRFSLVEKVRGLSVSAPNPLYCGSVWGVPHL